MDSTKRLYVALGALALGGVLVFQQTKKEQSVEQAHSLAAAQGQLPELALEEEVTKTIDTVELHVPPEKKEDGSGEAIDVVLKKQGDDQWVLDKPMSYPANLNNVTSLLKNLTSLKLVEQVSQRTDAYDKWGLAGDDALHAVFKKGDEVLLDAYFGNNGSRGQMTRLGNQDGVFAVSGFSRYLYARDVTNWRDKALFKFDDKDVEHVVVDNESGRFEFTRDGSSWKGLLKGKAIERFKASKVDDLLRAFKALNANGFGDDKKAQDVGLGEKALATVTITMKDGGQSYALKVGDTAEGSSRWVQVGGKDDLFSISSWAADWATAEPTKFQEKAEEADEPVASPE